MSDRLAFGWKVCVLACLLLAPTRGWTGVIENFGPFTTAEQPGRVAWISCEPMKTGRDGAYLLEEFTLPKENLVFLSLRTRVDGSQESGVDFRLYPGNDRPGYEWSLPDIVSVRDVLTADLNRDGRPDFVFPLETRRRPGEVDEDQPDPGRDVLFLLSSKRGHRFIRMEGVRYDEDGFVALREDGAIQWVHTTFIPRHSAQSRFEGRKIYFYLHRLFHVRGDDLAPDEGMDSRFPRFVLYTPGTKRRNHKETGLLSDEEKKLLMEKYPVKRSEPVVKVLPASRTGKGAARPANATYR
jgi:hypothetical protein